jgi:hypothetical protein
MLGVAHPFRRGIEVALRPGLTLVERALSRIALQLLEVRRLGTTAAHRTSVRVLSV